MTLNALLRASAAAASSEVVEDMLLLALMRSGETAKARAVLDHRLHRRPLPRYARWHGLLIA